MSSAIAARTWKVLDVQSNKRVVRVFKFYHEYRARYRITVNLAINETDYRIAFAEPSAAQVYLSQTGPHQINKKSVPVSLEELKEFERSVRAPRTPDRPRTKPLHFHPLTPPALRARPPIADQPDREEEENPAL
jgi:hypothetical protein